MILTGTATEQINHGNCVCSIHILNMFRLQSLILADAFVIILNLSH